MKPPYYILLALLVWGAVQRAVAVDQGSQQIVDRANLHLQAGAYYMERAQYDSTIIHLRQCIAHTGPADPMRSPAYILMTHCFKALALKDSALFYANKVVEVAQFKNDSSLQAEYLYTLGTIYAEHNNPRSAERHYLQSAQLAEKIGNPDLAAKAYGGASVVCVDREKTLQLAQKALLWAQKGKDTAEIAGRLSVLAAIYHEHGQLQRAQTEYRRAMGYFRQLHDTNGYKIAQMGLTSLFSQMGQQDSAWRAMNSEQDLSQIAYSADSLAPPNSMQGVKLDLLTSELRAEERAVQFDILSRQYWQDQATNLRTKVWLISIAGGLVILVLLLLYGRQRLRSKAHSRYIEGLEGERERIAKELHDGVCNDLLAVEMKLGQEVPAAQLELLQTVRRDVRLLSHELMPPAFQYASLDEILLDHTANLTLPKGCTLDFKHSEDAAWIEVSHTLAFQIYRIAQEAIGNSIRHASSTQIEVSLTKRAKQIKLSVTDNGTGFDPKNSSDGVGLRTLKDRATSIGGAVTIDTTPHGSTLTFTYNDNGTKGKHITG